MSQQILNLNNKLQINTLFLQPTRWCKLNCKGCYVKERSGGEADIHTDWKVQAELIKYYSEENLVNQITISMDDLPDSKKHHIHMKSLFIKLILDRQELMKDLSGKERIIPELHMTFNNLGAYKKYNYLSSEISDMASFYTLDLLSFSNIKANEEELLFIKNLKNGTHINYNYMIPNNVNKFNISDHIAKLIKISEVVDTIYLVAFKEPIGKKRTELLEIGDRSRMSSNLIYIDRVLPKLPNSIKSKINIDSCLQDVVKFQKTNFGCSANISKIQVWPDGSVSGCPYAYSSNTTSGYSLEDILSNIRGARKYYDFNRCHLPELYNSIV